VKPLMNRPAGRCDRHRRLKEFFAAPGIEEIPVDAASFRTLSKLSAGRRDAALASGALAIELNRWLEDRLRLPPRMCPDMNGPPRTRQERPNGCASNGELGYRRIPNIVHLLEAHGVRIFSLPEHLGEVDAFSFWWHGTPYILLNTRKSAERADASTPPRSPPARGSVAWC
jgi:hypothetical protein